MSHRHDLVGGNTTGEPLARRIEDARTLLLSELRPEWRQDVMIMIRPERVDAVCAVSGCPREVVSHGMCNGHLLRWIRRERPDLGAFLTSTPARLQGSFAPSSCQVPACELGLANFGLCWSHSRDWTAQGRPPRGQWITVADPGPRVTVRCRLPHCDLGVEDVSSYCRTHHRRWVEHERPAHEEFVAIVLNHGDPVWDFRRLPEQLQLEVQWALQRSHDLGISRGAHTYYWTVRMLARTTPESLLVHDRQEWGRRLSAFLPSDGGRMSNARAFLGFAVEQVVDLVEGDGWEREYPRDVWQLRRLGYVSPSVTRRLDFSDIHQEWLRDCAKKWVRWRLTVEEKANGTVTADLTALRRLSAFLTATGQAQHSIRQLTRPVLEQHVAWLHDETELARPSIRDSISAIAVFLRTLHEREDWAPDLPRNAVIYGSDYPRMDPLRARGLSVYVLAQVKANLPAWSQPEGRFLTELMLASGLRIGDACALEFDPIVTDRDGHPYIRYWNHKMRREAYVPISAVMLDKVRAQQQRVREVYRSQVEAYLATPAPVKLPAVRLRLVPATQINPDGIKPYRTSTYNDQLRRWAATAEIRDEAGRPAAITAHRWRHTFATSLINAGVRLEVVQQLLDHATLEMSSHYARLLDTTVRAEWQNARGQDADLDQLLPADVEWANRARAALPNGHCGLPRQQSCDHSNKCLTCPVFITGEGDLPAHEAHRRRTLTLIAKFDATGQTRLADENRLVLDHLETRIDQIKRALASPTEHAGAG